MTGADDNLQTTDFRPDGLAVRLFEGPRDGGYTRILAAFLLASASHLWLADAAQPEWLGANIVYVIGLVLLIATRGAAGWLCCAVGLIIPLLFLRDQLTQSVLLLAVSLAGAWSTMRRPARTEPFIRTARGLLIATYGFAAFHKLNHDFFDPAVGCATYGLRELAEYYRLPSDTFSLFGDAHGLLGVAFEVAIPVLYLLGRRHFARVVAVLFHIPLTLTMAPAFAFVMVVPHAAFVTDDDVARIRDAWRAHRVVIVGASMLITVASLAAHGSLPEWTMIPREWSLWFALVLGVLALRRGRAAPLPPSSQRSAMPLLVVGLFSLNCSSPYLGLQFQHSAAMLSNLRIDAGCWNHLIVPEAVRLTEDYVRVDAVAFGHGEGIPEYEETVRRQLWSPPQFRQMQRNWCRPEIRPLALKGTFRGERFDIPDLCDRDAPWPFENDGVLGVEVFGNYLRFQKNLERECPQMCIH